VTPLASLRRACSRDGHLARQIKLVVINGDAEGRESTLTTSATVGSGEEAQMRLPESGGVAAIHARIDLHGNAFWLRNVCGHPCAVRVQGHQQRLHLHQCLMREAAGGTRRAIQQLQHAKHPRKWKHLAVHVTVCSSGRRSFISFPTLKVGKQYYLGRGAKNTVTLADVKAKKKHGVLLLQGRRPPEDGEVPADRLMFMPYKGKPCMRLLGRRDHSLGAMHIISAGDVFVVGQSLVRVLFVGTWQAPDKLLITEDDGLKFGRWSPPLLFGHWSPRRPL